MANTVLVKDANGNSISMSSTDLGPGSAGANIQLHLVGLSDGVAGAPITNASPLPVSLQQPNLSVQILTSRQYNLVTGTFTRPNNSTAYVSGQMVASNTTNTAVAYSNLAITQSNSGMFAFQRVKLKKSGNSATSASFRVHFYYNQPTFITGDGAAFMTNEAGYIGSCNVAAMKAFSDGCSGIGSPDIGSEIRGTVQSGNALFWALEATAAYSPANSEIFTLTVESASKG